MKLLALLALCAVAYASRRGPRHESQWYGEIERTHAHEHFADNHKYIYKYNGQLATGIPGTSNQHSATRVQAIVEVILAADNKASLKIERIRIGKLNGELPNPREVMPFQLFGQEDIETQLKELLLKPVHFKYNNGLVKEVQFEESDQPWSENLKKGILSMLQINMHKQRQIIQGSVVDEQMNKPLQAQDYFVATETTVEGDCATFYTVTEQPKRWRQSGSPVLNITKTIDFSECDRQGAEQRPDIRYNFRFSESCPTCQDRYDAKEKMLDSSSVYKFSVKGDNEQFRIERVTVESQYTFIPFTEESNVIVTYVNQTLELVKSSQKNGVEQINSPSQKKSLVYSMEWDQNKEEHFLEKNPDFFEQSSYPKIAGNKNKLVKNIMMTLNSDIKQNDEGQTRQFARLVTVLRMCSRQDLKLLFKNYFLDIKEFTPENQQKIRQLFVDALGLAGTRQTMDLIIKEISKIGPIRGALALKSFVNARVVDADMITHLFNFGKNLKGESSKGKQMLRQSALLTAATLMNKVCRDNTQVVSDKIAIQLRTDRPALCNKQEFVSAMKLLWNQAKAETEDTYEQILALKVIANAGIDTTVKEILEPIIKNELRLPVAIRSQAIESLRLLRSSTMRRKVQQLLMPIYMNEKEMPELRMVAVYQIMQTLPEQPILEQIAKQVYTERSRHVASFVLTHLYTIANSTNPCEQRVADDLKLALRHAKSMPFARYSPWSMLIHTTLHSNTYRAGLDIDVGAVKSNSSYLPKKIGMNVNTNLMSYWQKSIFSLGAEQFNMDEVLFRYIRSDGLLSEVDSYLDLFDSSKVSPRHQPTNRNTLKNLYQKMEINERRYSDEANADPMLMLYMRYKDQDYGMLPIKPEHIRAFYKSNGKLDLSALRNFQSSFEQHMGSFVSEFSRKIPTAMGLPLQITVKVPTVASIRGNIKIEHKNNQLVLKIKATPTIVSTMVTEVETWLPIVNSGLKVVAQALVNLPVHGEIKLNPAKQEMEFKMKLDDFEKKDEEQRLITLETYPTTYTRSWPKQINEYWPEPIEKTIRSQQWNRVQKVDKSYGEDALGLKFNVRGYYHRTPSMRVAGTPVCPLSGPNKIQITVRPVEQTPKKIVLKFKLNTHEKERLMQSDVLKQFFSSEDKEFFENERSSEEADNSEESFRTYQEEFKAVNVGEMELKITLLDDSQLKRQTEALLRQTCGEEGRHCQYKLVLKREKPSNQQFKVEVESDVLYPQIPNSIADLADRKMLTTIVARFGDSLNNLDQEITIKMEGERSREQERLDRKRPYHQMYRNEKLREMHPELFSAVSQYDELLKAAVLTQFKIDADYQIDERFVAVKNFTSWMFDMVKYQLYPNTYVNAYPKQSQRGEPNRIRAIVTFDPISLQQMNATIEMPRQVVRMVDLPMWMPLSLPNTRRSYTFYNREGKSLSSWNEPATCKVQSRRVRSFDNSVYRLPLTTCYTLLAKDCRENSNFAVLIKKQSEQSEKKVVRVISKHHDLVIKKSGETYEVKVDGSIKELSEMTTKMVQNHVVLRLLERGTEENKYVKIALPEAGVTVYFDGYTATVKLANEHQRFQCGICGHFDNEDRNEYRLPSNELTDDIKEFNSKYIWNEGCTVPEERINDDSNYELEEYKWEDEVEDLDEEFQQAEQRTPYSQQMIKPRKVTQVKEVASRICFSTEPVHVCPSGSYPKEFSQENHQIKYRCISRSNPQAEILHEKALRQRVISNDIKELSRSSIDDDIDQVIPTDCKQY